MLNNEIFLFVFIIKDDITGDGTTSNVLIIGELLKQVTDVEMKTDFPPLMLASCLLTVTYK